MKKHSLLYVLLFSPAVLFSQSNWQDTANKINSIFSKWDKKNTPGAALSISRNGQVIFSGAWGMADLEHDVENTTQTIFEAGSVSKQFTAAAILLLEQQGKLSIEDDIRKYVAEMPDYGHIIKIRHLINHTSGLRDWGSVAAVGGWPRSSRAYTHAHALQIICRQQSLNNKPGDEFIYSNSNYNLMAIITERVSKMSFAAYCKQYLFGPAGMKNTQWRDDYTRIVKNRAVAYSKGFSGYYTLMPFENVHGNGGLLTTTADLLLWVEKYTKGEIAGKDFFYNQIRQGVLNNGSAINYASGLFIDIYNSKKTITHSGATAGYRANLEFYPELNLSIALLSNDGSLEPVAIAHQVADIFIPPIPSSAAAATPPVYNKLKTEELQQYAGWYRNTKNNEGIKLFVKEGKLISGNGIELNALTPGYFSYNRNTVKFVNEESRSGAHFISPSGDTIYFQKMDSGLTGEKLAIYTGEYHSEEADATVSIRLKDGKLYYQLAPLNEVLLTPAYKDGFENYGNMIWFTKNKKQKIEGFRLSVGRARNIFFKKSG
ncbi:MAG: serine hydrolase domain-containing protein [Chitinophagaceae bacterium]|nr:serine hydrolase domain-containing protein [Chitinophagaceae bacterium]